MLLNFLVTNWNTLLRKLPPFSIVRRPVQSALVISHGSYMKTRTKNRFLARVISTPSPTICAERSGLFYVFVVRMFDHVKKKSFKRTSRDVPRHDVPRKLHCCCYPRCFPTTALTIQCWKKLRNIQNAFVIEEYHLKSYSESPSLGPRDIFFRSLRKENCCI